MGLFGKIATLAAVALPGKAIAASRGKTTSAAGGTPPPPPPPAAGGGVKAKTGAGGPGPGSIGGIAAPAPGGQVQGQGRQTKEEAMQIEIDDDLAREFEYIVQLHRAHGARAKMENIEMLIHYVLTHVANGSRRPGSWERGLLVHMGLVAECDEHHEYRPNFGASG